MSIKQPRIGPSLLLLLLPFVTIGCGPAGLGDVLGVSGGTLDVLIEAAGNETTFESNDGWVVTFDRVVGSLSEVSLDPVSPGNDRLAEVDAIALLGEAPFDLAPGVPVGLYQFSDLPTERARFGFVVSEPRLDVEADEQEAADDSPGGELGRDPMELLVEDEAAFRILGSAQSGDETVKFDLSIAGPLGFRECHDGERGEAGVVIAQDDATEVVLSLDLRGLFQLAGSSSGGDSPSFDAFASAADPSGLITNDELNATPAVAGSDQSLKEAFDRNIESAFGLGSGGGCLFFTP